MESSTEPCYQDGVLVTGDGQRFVVNPFASATIQNNASHSPPDTTYSSYCAHCDLHFDNLNEFEHHNITMHSQIKAFSCELCNATFRRRDHLKRHTLCSHSNDNSCKCPVCGKDYKRQDILQNHFKKKHLGKMELFRCSDCDYQSENPSDLERHANTHSSTDSHAYTHSSTDRHQCPHCQTTFKRRDHMLRHIKSQHLKQSANCPLCGQMYKRKDHVARHVREKHKMGYLNGKLVRSSDFTE